MARATAESRKSTGRSESERRNRFSVPRASPVNGLFDDVPPSARCGRERGTPRPQGNPRRRYSRARDPAAVDSARSQRWTPDFLGRIQRIERHVRGALARGGRERWNAFGRTVDDWAAGRFSAVVCFPARMLRSADVQVGWDPVDNDPSHCNAWAKSGEPFPRRRSLRKRLANETGRRFFAVEGCNG